MRDKRENIGANFQKMYNITEYYYLSGKYIAFPTPFIASWFYSIFPGCLYFDFGMANRKFYQVRKQLSVHWYLVRRKEYNNQWFIKLKVGSRIAN